MGENQNDFAFLALRVVQETGHKDMMLGSMQSTVTGKSASGQVGCDRKTAGNFPGTDGTSSSVVRAGTGPSSELHSYSRQVMTY